MHVLYFNKPWILDKTEYNCSSRTASEWRLRGTVDQIQGVYFFTSGIFFVILYLLSLVGMVRGRLTRIPCYRLMFFNGIVDLMNLFAGSLIVSYFHFVGAVACSNITVNLIVGHLAWSLWIGSTFSCISLALNRVAEMIPSARGLRILFRDKTVYIWIWICVAIMIIRPFITRPVFFNTAISAYLAIPVISDDVLWETSHYISILLPLHNISTIVVIGILYIILCSYVANVNRQTSNSIDRAQLLLFIQALIICTSTAIAAILYVFVEFVPVPRSIVIFGNVVWQLSHGIHGIVYICINRHIRRELSLLFGCYDPSENFFAIRRSTITTGN